MKSVVVEASTVAKAIEAAWLKADKPEEFFIRILQAHSSGFLGFGAQKAKVVFFFKNSHKSDSLFPVVVKQKEYASFFGNFNLKVPTEVNVVDSELNKSVSLGGQHKKKPHNGQNNQNVQQKAKQNNPQPDVRSHSNVTKVAAHPVGHKAPQERFVDASMQTGKPVNKQVKVQHNAPKQLSHDKILANEAAVNKLLQPAPKMQVSLQTTTHSSKVAADNKAMTHKKEDVVKDVAKVLKKIQTQKIVANVSRTSHVAHDKNAVKSDETLTKTAASVSSSSDKIIVDKVHRTAPKSTVKFESYADFINSTTGIPVEKESLISPIDSKKSIVEAVDILHKSFDLDKNVKSVLSDVAITTKEEVAPVISQPSKPTSATPRVPLKFKRRPLSTENSGVSGIVKSSDVVEPAQQSPDNAADVSNLDDKK